MMDHERERDGVVPEEEKSWASYDEAADAAEQERGPEDHADTDTESMNTGVTEEDPEPDASAYGGDEDAPMEEEDIAAEEEPYSGGDDEEYDEEDGAYGEEAADSEDFDFDYNEEPENLAEIAERILGARHSRASTAAPIRTRADREREARSRDALNQPGSVPGPVSGGVQSTNPAGPSQTAAPQPDVPRADIHPENADRPRIPDRQEAVNAPPIPVQLPAQNGGMPEPTAASAVPNAPNPQAVNPAMMNTAERPAVNQAMMNTAERPAVNPAMMSTAERKAVNPAAFMNTAERKAVNPAAFMNTAERQAIRAEREKAAAEAKAKEEAARKKKNVTTAVIAALCALVVLGGAVGIGVGASRRNRAADPDQQAGDAVETEQNEQENPGELPGQTSAEGGNSISGEKDPEEAPDTGNEPAEPGNGDQGGEQNENPSGDQNEDPGPETDDPAHETDPAEGTGESGETDPSAVTPEPQNPPEEEPAQGEDNAGTVPVHTDPEPAEPPVEETPARPEKTETTVPSFRVQVNFYNRDPLTVDTQPTTLRQLLADNGVTLKDGEQPSIGLDERLTESVTCSVDLYEYVYVDETVSIPYETEEIGVDTIPRGTTQSIQAGVNGEKVSHYYVAKKNGEEFDRRLEWEEVTKEPVNEQYYLGVGGWLTGIDGVAYSYSWRRVCPATYYTTYGLTWLGTDASSRTVAADFGNFPLGTKLYIRNDRYDCGYRVVEDTGERLDPWQVDIWMDASDPNYPLMVQEDYVYDMVVYVLD